MHFFYTGNILFVSWPIEITLIYATLSAKGYGKFEIDLFCFPLYSHNGHRNRG